MDRLKKRQEVHRFAFLTNWFIARLFVISMSWIFLIQCFKKVNSLEPIKEFIPHELLGVALDAPIPVVRKAYRKLSRQLHPDKNPDNPQAVNDFIQITKAYTVSSLANFS